MRSRPVDIVYSEAEVGISGVVVQAAVYREVRIGQHIGEQAGWCDLHQPLQVIKTNNILSDGLGYQS